jgi:hypothetical protein
MSGQGMDSIWAFFRWVRTLVQNTDTEVARGSNLVQLLDISLIVEKIGARGPASLNEELL